MKKTIQELAKEHSSIIHLGIQNDITTSDELKNSPFYTDYWLASEAYAKKLLTYHYDWMLELSEYNGFDFAAWTLELTSIFIDKYTKLCEKVSTEGDNFKYNGYCSTICYRFLADYNKKYVVKETVSCKASDGSTSTKTTLKRAQKEDGTSYYVKLQFTSLDMNIDEDNKLSLLDTLSEHAPTLENTFIQQICSTEHIVEYMNEINRRRQTKGHLFAFINTILVASNEDQLSNSLRSRMIHAKKNNIKMVDLYNFELTRLANIIHLSDADLMKFTAVGDDETVFGQSLHFDINDDKSLSNRMSDLASDNKKRLAAYLKIELPVQNHKNKCSIQKTN